MTQFLIQSGKHLGKMLVIPEDVIVIGRDSECQIRLNSEDVSRRHCQISVTDSQIVARDLGSRNGTFVNELAIEQETPLTPGDQVRVGPLILQIPGGEKNVSKKEKADPGGTSDDDIANWLTPEDAESSAGSGDSTIITGANSINQTSAPITTPEPPPVKKIFKSLADEAADIIRRHHERLRNDE